MNAMTIRQLIAAGLLTIFVLPIPSAIQAGEFPVADMVVIEKAERKLHLMQNGEIVFYAALAVAVGLTIRYSREIEFRTTPTDYLLVFIVVAIGILPGEIFNGNQIATGLIKAIILIYSCELLMLSRLGKWNPMSLSTLFALGWLAGSGLF